MGFLEWLKQILGGRRPTLSPRRADSAISLPPTAARPQGSTPVPPRPPVELNLDPGPFAPLSGDDASKQAKSLDSPWANPLFGRRDLIPPVTDARTLLIDRAMVGQGLVTPEELAEIHQIGEQMDKVRPDLAIAAHQATLAARHTLEERQRIKARKRAEAAERKQRHAEAVLHRKRTDIIFLGRDVSAGLADRRANVEKLQASGLPVLATPANVAQVLGLSIQRLRWLAFHTETAAVTHYVRFNVPKRSGGIRQLAAPHDDLAEAQQWILTNILQKLPPHEAAHGFVPGRSTVTSARLHVGRALILNADLRDFFPTITFHRVAGLFRHMGYSPAAATILALLCTESPRRTVCYSGQTLHVATGPRSLPQGACTSPALSNLTARRLDARLSGIARKLGWTYTRYADDLTFSADAGSDHLVGYLLARLRHIASDEGFAVNEDKTRILRPHMPQTVTGILVNVRPGVSRKLIRRLRAILHQAQYTGLESQNRENLPHFHAWLRGMLAYISMVNPEQARPLQEAFEVLHP